MRLEPIMRALLPLLLTACSANLYVTANNSPPEATILAPAEGESAVDGSRYVLRGSAGDPTTSPEKLTAAWFVDNEPACPPAAPQPDGTTECEITVPPQTADIRLDVRDPDGAAVAAAVVLGVLPNAAPTLTLDTPVADAPYASDRLIPFRVTVSDAEDVPERLTVRWVSSLDGDLALDAPVTSSGVSEGFGRLTEGEHALQAYVTDTGGRSTSTSVIVRVGPPNADPSCEILLPLTGAAYGLGDTVVFEGLATDPDSDPTTLVAEWRSDKDGQIGLLVPASDGSLRLPVAALSANEHRVTLKVTDPFGATCVDDVLVSVNAPPSVVITSPPNGGVVNANAAVTLGAVVSDVEDAPQDLTVTWESDLDGVLRAVVPDPSGTSEVVIATLSAGTHRLTATATDTSGVQGTSTVQIRVNAAPGAPEVSITPADPGTDADLFATVTLPSVDPEGDAVIYTYAWIKNGNQPTGLTSALAPAAQTTRGDRWTVTVTPIDANFAEGPSATASVVIGNSVPSVQSVEITPGVLRTDDLATVTAVPYDADGDPVSLRYQWKVNGTNLAGATGATLSGVSSFRKGDRVSVSAWASDAGGEGPERTSAVLTVQNSAPSAPELTLTASTALPGDDVRCAILRPSVDPDGDTVAYSFSWSAGGQTMTSRSTFYPGDTTTVQLLNPAVDWDCLATASDGAAVSTPGTVRLDVFDCDVDRDGYSSDVCAGGDDCDDSDAAIKPFAGDAYGDGTDEDCDGVDATAGYAPGGTYYGVFVESRGATPLTYAYATSVCEALGYDGLAALTTQDENQYVTELGAVARLVNPSFTFKVRIEGKDDAVEGQWLNPRTGSPLALAATNFLPGTNQPDRLQNCLLLNVDPFGSLSEYGRWEDHSCGDDLPANGAYVYACEAR
jgi:hypothetical protein